MVVRAGLLAGGFQQASQELNTVVGEAHLIMTSFTQPPPARVA
jgi:hypothetical protein